jgi:hypothetical protein
LNRDHPAAQKLLFGTLLVGASALPAGSVISGLLAGVGGNWVAEAVGGVIGAGPPPDAALTRAFARAVQTAVAELHIEYGAERVRRDGSDAFALLRQSARSVTTVTPVADAHDIAAVQHTLSGALTKVLYGFPDAQVRLLRERLLSATARAFHSELAREPEAWRLYHSWVFERLLAQNVALQHTLATHPVARAELIDAAALEDRLESFTGQLDALITALRAELHAAAELVIDQSEQQDGTSYGAFNQFGTADSPPIPSGKTRIDQSKQSGGRSYGAFNTFGSTPLAEEEDG